MLIELTFDLGGSPSLSVFASIFRGIPRSTLCFLYLPVSLVVSLSTLRFLYLPVYFMLSVFAFISFEHIITGDPSVDDLNSH